MNAARVECQRLVTGLKRRAAETCEALRRSVLKCFKTHVIKRLRRDENAPRAEPLNLERWRFRMSIVFTSALKLTRSNFCWRTRDSHFWKSECTAIYTRMLQLLLERWPNFAPQTISLDFELAMVGAVRTVLPACSVRYCFFHLIRNMKKQIRGLGLTRVYNTDPIFAEKSKMITSLAFLPVHHLQAGLNALQAQLPAQLHGVFNWFMDNYTGRMRFNVPMSAPLFDPHEWSVYQRTLDGADRTNNFAEAFHRKLQRQFSCTHPTI
ncbi:hypothetical protein niasHT_011479 [Heterodera trifolii]|uniref:MULE transposase domain-containing protein n=1 Tax=Heterodera trifolii TaxID=157864 RepID=A0ABD2L1A6_9BILA